MSISDSEQHDLLDQLAEEFAARFRRGERPALKEYIDRYPELAEEIRERFPAMVTVEQAEGVRQGEEDEEVTRDSRAANPPLRQIGDYRILREIGRGGMGVVYEAEQVSLGRRVALKVLPRQASRDRLVEERFRREARAAARLHHTNIVPVYDVGQDGDVRYYAMQFIEGQGLDAVITELRRLLDRARSQSTMEAASGGRSLWPRREQPRQGVEAPTLGEGVEVSPVLRYVLTGRFGPGGPSPELVGASQSMLVRALTGGIATPTGTGTESRAAGSGAALTSTGAGSATAGDTTGPRREHPPALTLSPSASPSSSSAILPGGAQLSSAESGQRAFFRSLAHIGRQVAGGLAYAHARGIVHRDIKPSNLLLDTEGVVWIADFGLAKGDDEGLTHTGDILGTLRFMAPERFRGEGDARADIYALGLTLYELLTLRPGFDSPDRLKLIEQIKTEEPPKPRAVDARIPRDLETIVLKAIEKDPKARYQSAEAMGEDLGRFLADEPIRARQVRAAERYWRWARRNPVIAVLGGVISGLLVLATLSSLLAMERFRAQAETQRTLAAQEAAARGKADQANTSLLATQEELRRAVYATRSNLALAAWEANDLGRLRFQLDLMQPRQDEPELRGWEWQYLNRLAHEEHLTFRDHDREVSQVTFSPDGRTVASVQWGGRVKLWDPATGHVRLTLQPKQPSITNPLQAGVSGLAFSPDGERLAGPGPDATLGIWNTHTGALLRQFKVSSGGTPTVAFSPDGRTIATGSATLKVRIWDAADGRLLRVFENAHDRTVQRVVFSPDGRRLASAGDGKIKLWDVETGRQHSAIACRDHAVFGLTFSPDGRTLVSGGSEEVVRIWDAGTGRERGQLWGHASTVTALAFRPDGRRLASGGSDAVVRLWDIDSGRQLRTFKGHTDRICSLAFSPDGSTLASSSFDKTVKLWAASRPSQPLVLTSRSLTSYTASAHCVAFSPDSRQIASAHSDKVVRVWEAATGRLRLTLTGHCQSVVALAFSPSGETIASGSVDNTVRLWDAATGEPRITFTGHTGELRGVVFTPDGQTVLSGGYDRTIQAWDPTTGVLRYVLRGHSEAVHDLAIGPDGRTLASASDTTCILWDLPSGQPRVTLRGHTSVIYSAAFSPDGWTVATSSGDRTVRLWDAADGSPRGVLKGHTDQVDGVAFSPDGRRLVSSGHDQTVRLWDLASGQDLLTLKGHSGWVRSVAFSGDGRQIASASDDGTVIVWDASPME